VGIRQQNFFVRKKILAIFFGSTEEKLLLITCYSDFQHFAAFQKYWQSKLKVVLSGA